MASVAISLLLIVLGGWVIMAPLIVAPAWRIFRRAGASPWLGVVASLPVIGLLVGALVLDRSLRRTGAPAWTDSRAG